MREKEKINEILRDLDPETERLFRINAGVGWAGDIVKNKSGFLVLKNARPLKAAPKGWPDLCGWTTITIDSSMVGQKVAVFRFDEIKLTGKLSHEQQALLNLLKKMGGLCTVHTE